MRISVDTYTCDSAVEDFICAENLCLDLSCATFVDSLDYSTIIYKHNGREYEKSNINNIINIYILDINDSVNVIYYITNFLY